MTDIIIQGIHGRMGRALCTMIEARTDCRVVAGVDAKELPSAVPVFPSLEKNTVPADVLIDFSNPDATQNAIEYCRAHKLPCVICTTGLSEGQEQALRELSKTVAVFKSANMSLGVNLLIELAKQANAVLGTDFDVEIIEKHHHNKLDAPSGTAKMLLAALDPEHEKRVVTGREGMCGARTKEEIGVMALRGGTVAGEHTVYLFGEDETLSITHTASSRRIFAVGAVKCGERSGGQKTKGWYQLDDILFQ